MGSLERRLEAVEAERKMGEARLNREALTYLSDEDLDALEDVLVAGSEKAGERGQRAVVAINEILDALRREGRDPKEGAHR